MSKIKILWVFPSFSATPSVAPAAVARFTALAPALGGDYEHVVTALDGDYGAAALLPAGFKIEQSRPAMRPQKQLSLRNMWAIRTYLGELRPNMIVTTNYDALDWLLVNRGASAAPHVHMEDPLDAADTLDGETGARAWSRRRAYPGRARGFVTGCRALAERMVEAWGAAEDAVTMLPRSVDVAAYAGIRRREGNGRTVFGSTAALTPGKRHDRLLRLVASLRERGRDAHALLLGDGPEKSRLTALAAELKITEALDWGARYDHEAGLARMDVMAITSDVDRADATLATGMAAGLPILSTAVLDAAELVSPLNKLFVRPVADESALVAAGELLSADAALRLALGEANRATAAATLSHGAVAARFDEALRRAAGSAWRLALPAPTPAPTQTLAEPVAKPSAAQASKPDAAVIAPKPAPKRAATIKPAQKAAPHPADVAKHGATKSLAAAAV